jgi:hypothetical protein
VVNTYKPYCGVAGGAEPRQRMDVVCSLPLVPCSIGNYFKDHFGVEWPFVPHCRAIFFPRESQLLFVSERFLQARKEHCPRR